MDRIHLLVLTKRICCYSLVNWNTNSIYRNMLTSFTKKRRNGIIWLKARIWKLWGTRRGYEKGRFLFCLGDKVVICLFIYGFFNDTTVFSYKHQVTYEFCFSVNSFAVLIWNSKRKHADERSPCVVLKWKVTMCGVKMKDHHVWC